jgi:hypothetical protein
MKKNGAGRRQRAEIAKIEAFSDMPRCDNAIAAAHSAAAGFLGTARRDGQIRPGRNHKGKPWEER